MFFSTKFSCVCTASCGTIRIKKILFTYDKVKICPIRLICLWTYSIISVLLILLNPNGHRWIYFAYLMCLNGYSNILIFTGKQQNEHAPLIKLHIQHIHLLKNKFLMITKTSHDNDKGACKPIQIHRKRKLPLLLLLFYSNPRRSKNTEPNSKPQTFLAVTKARRDKQMVSSWTEQTWSRSKQNPNHTQHTAPRK